MMFPNQHPRSQDTQPLRLPADRPVAYCPPGAERHSARWRINGHPATIFIWTADEWERLEHHPVDAQYYPCGIWCALRMDATA